MQPSLPTQPQPEPENKCPDCLYIKLEGIPVQPENQDYLDFWSTSTQTEQIDLHLSVKFSEQWLPLRQGRVKFGLKGGELRLKLKNGEIPYESRELTGSFELSLIRERQKPEANRELKGTPPIARAIAPPSMPPLNGKTKGQANPGTEQRLGKNTPSASVCQITTKVSEENPVWIFEEERGKPVLNGVLKKAKLATLNVTALPCSVEATFEVSKRDICLTDAEGLWPSNISRNKRAVLDRLIIQRLLDPKFKPYLSRAELLYD